MFLSAVDFSREDYSLWGNLAESYYWSGQKEKAIEYYKRAIKYCEPRLQVNPKDTYIIADLAGYKAMVGSRDEATSLISKAVRFGIHDPGVMFTIAVIYEHLGIRDKAIDWIAKAVNNGYSLSEIELYPGLSELRKDKKYTELTSSLSSEL